MVKVAIVVAVGQNGVIGRGNRLPWHLPADLKHFKTVTMGKPVIMGRKTFQSIGRALPGRDNIVISHARRWSAGGVTVVPSFEAAVEVGKAKAETRNVDEVAVIGGAQIYHLALPYTDRIYWTEVELSPEGDTFFPTLDPAQWQEVSRVRRAAEGEYPAHSYVVYERRRPE